MRGGSNPIQVFKEPPNSANADKLSYKRTMSRADAEKQILAAAKTQNPTWNSGLYLIRDKSDDSNKLVLTTWKPPNKIENIIIESENNMVKINAKPGAKGRWVSSLAAVDGCVNR